jgi:TolB-like protein
MPSLSRVLFLLLAGAPLAASPALAEEEPIQIVVLGLETTELEAGKVALVDGIIADTISRAPRLKVLTKSDIERLAAFESDKALLGCDASNCLAEVAGALGAAYVVFGRIGTLDDLILVQLNLFDARKAQPVGRQEVRAASLRALDGAVQPAVQRLLSPLTGEVPVEAPAPSSGPGALAIGGFAAGGVLLVAGGVLAGIGLAQVPVVEDSTKSAIDRNEAKALGAGLVIAGGVGLGLAALGTAIGVVGMVIE